MNSMSLVLSLSLLTCIAYLSPSYASQAVNGAERSGYRKPKLVRRVQFPYIMKLVEAGSNHTVCLGVLITRSSVLSSAMCVTNYEGKTFPTECYVGVFDSAESEVDESRVKFREFRVHEAFNLRLYSNDVSIMILEQEMKLNEFIDIIALPRKGVTFDGEIVAAIGRVPHVRDGYSENVLKYIEGNVENSRNCSYYAEDFGKHVCIIDKDYKIRIINGGPLVRKADRIYTSIGINSAFFRTELDGFSRDFYVSTSFYYDWIKENAVGEITYT